MALEKLFPTQIYRSRWTSSQKLVANLVRESYAIQKMDSAGRSWSKQNYPQGYTSYSSIADLPLRSSNFETLKKWIDRQVVLYAKKLELDLGEGRLEMTTCWINIMGKHSHHAFHLHPTSTISGTFYLQVPQGSGALKFEDPRIACFMASPPRKTKSNLENRRYVEIISKPGDLVLFESWLKHEVVANQGREDRLSVSFNYDWVR